MGLLLLVLPLVSLIYPVSGQAVPVLDVYDTPVLTGQKYRLQLVNEFGTPTGGIQIERRGTGLWRLGPNRDFLRATKSANDPGVSVFLWRSENAYVPSQVINTALRLKIQLTQSSFEHRTLVSAYGDEILLARDDERNSWTPFTLTPVTYPHGAPSGVKAAYTLNFNPKRGATSCVTLDSDGKWFTLPDQCGIDGTMFEFYPVVDAA